MIKSEETQLMGSEELRTTFWSKKSRPTQDWIRFQARLYLKDKTKGLPCRKVFGRILFDIDEVRKRLGLNGGGR